ncbi:MAG: hypothetical protein KatS3mg035_0016 [Bacteroidia bacterium]|nr:MAG: hypothetical protein KatS3mg035_0016 [Bacteroidia bacterium]
MNTSKIPRINEQFWIFFISIGVFSIFLGFNRLFDWDEINFAESAREMLVTQDFFRVQINYEPFWEKPPLFFWLQALCMQVLGVHEFSARLPNAIIGGFTLISLYRTGTQIKDVTFGRILVLLYFGSILPHFYFKSSIIDPVFNVFIFLGLYHIIRYEQIVSETRRLLPWEIREKKWAALKAGFWIGLATLTKGPVALLMLILTYSIFILLFQIWVIRIKQILLFILSYALIVGSWFGWETYVHGSWFIEKFIQYQIELFTQPVAGHEQPFYYHFLVVFLGCFPMSLFFIPGMGELPERHSERLVRKFMMIWFWVVLIVFSISKTKIVHYSSMTYFPGAYLAASFLYYQIKEDLKFPWHTYLIYAICILVFGVGITLFLIFAPHIKEYTHYIKDVHVLDALNTPLHWLGGEYWIGIFYSLMMVIGLVLLIYRQTFLFLILFALATPIFLNLINYYIVPKIAIFTQTSAVNFWRSKVHENAYLVTYGYKSYAHYFYGKIQPHNALKNDLQWVLDNEKNKIIYVSTKLKDYQNFEKEYQGKFQFLYQNGGFRFYKIQTKKE